jgi:DNA-binding transcriptional LysR family regulator
MPVQSYLRRLSFLQGMAVPFSFEQLEAFRAVAVERHFTRAAARLHLAQPALTKRIQQLERQLGVALFVRTGRTVRLTPAGSTLLEPAGQALAAAGALATTAARLAVGEAGALRIGFSPSAPHHVLPAALRAFRRSHPAVRCLLSELGSDAQVMGLLAGDLDVGILRPPAVVPSLLVCRRFLEEPFVAVLPRDHPLAARRTVALGDLAGDAFVLIARRVVQAVHDQILAACRSAGFVPAVVQEGTHVHGVAGLVASGLGVSILPASAASLGLRDVVCRRLRRTPLTTVVAVATRRLAPLPAAVAFVDAVLRHTPTPRRATRPARRPA